MIRPDQRRGTSAARRESRRVGKILTPDLTEALGAHVARAFRDAQERVGVESGALRASGRSGHELRDGDDTFVGWVAYGNDTQPVDYAIYHLAVNEPWFERMPAHEAAMEETIDRHIREHLR